MSPITDYTLTLLNGDTPEPRNVVERAIFEAFAAVGYSAQQQQQPAAPPQPPPPPPQAATQTAIGLMKPLYQRNGQRVQDEGDNWPRDIPAEATEPGEPDEPAGKTAKRAAPGQSKRRDAKKVPTPRINFLPDGKKPVEAILALTLTLKAGSKFMARDVGKMLIDKYGVDLSSPVIRKVLDAATQCKYFSAKRITHPEYPGLAKPWQYTVCTPKATYAYRLKKAISVYEGITNPNKLIKAGKGTRRSPQMDWSHVVPEPGQTMKQARDKARYQHAQALKRAEREAMANDEPEPASQSTPIVTKGKTQRANGRGTKKFNAFADLRAFMPGESAANQS